MAAIAREAVTLRGDGRDLASSAARLIVQELGDAAVVILTSPPGEADPLAVGTHRDPSSAALLEALLGSARVDDLVQFTADVAATELAVVTIKPERPGSWHDNAYRSYTGVAGLAMSAFAPIRGADRVLGVIACTRDAGSIPYAVSDLDAVAAAADILGTFVDAERARERERSVDRQRQVAFDTAPIGMIVMDPRGVITHINPAGGDVFGRPTEDIVGRSWEDFSPPEDIDEGRADADRMLRGAAISVLRTTAVVRPDGARRQIRASSVLVRRVDGEPASYHAQFVDVTDLLAAERQVAALAEQRRVLLAQLVVAEQAERERIAHDLHDEPVQLLAAALLRLQTLTRRTDADNVADLVVVASSIAAASDRLRGTLRGLETSVWASTNMNAALRTAAAELFDGSGTTVTVEGDITGLSTDIAAVLHRATREAMSNTRRHASARTLRVQLRDDHRGAVVSVTDDGTGLPDPVPERPGHLGTRAMVNRIEALGGTTRFERPATGGTRVVIRVPRRLREGGPGFDELV